MDRYFQENIKNIVHINRYHETEKLSNLMHRFFGYSYVEVGKFNSFLKIVKSI